MKRPVPGSRTLRALPSAALAALLLLQLPARAADAPGDAPEPTIKSTTRRAAPPDNLIVIEKTPPAVASPELVLENYRQELALNPDPQTRAEALRRIADIEMQLADAHGPEDPDSRRNLDAAIATYEQLLREQPHPAHGDSVLYQLARAYRMTERTPDAIATLQRLSREYPDSDLADDAHFIAGELLFRDHHFAAAEQEYLPLVRKGAWSGTLFEPSQYKYAWSLFDQDKYDASAKVFIDILDRLLPRKVPDEPEAALAQVDKDRADIARDSLRGMNLAFIQLGAPKALNDFFAGHPDPRFAPLIYISLGDTFLEKHRYSDAAETYQTFVSLHPNDPDAPVFETRTIAAYQAGGFSEAALSAKGAFANAYAPDSPFWKNRKPSQEVLDELHQHLTDLAQYHHARAQKDPVANHADFAIAADWYRKILKDFPHDPHNAQTNLALADALLEGGSTREAADEYMRTAYDYPKGPKSAEAGYAAVQTYERYVQEVPADQKPAAEKISAAAGIRLADEFPDHPQKIPVLTRAAEELFATGDLPAAVAAAARVLAADPPAAPPLRRSALAVTADSQFSLQHYAEAERAYAGLLEIIPKDDPQYAVTEERHTASIYKAADAARAAGDLRTAAQAYQRLGQTASSASVRAKADYDAAATYIQMQDWADAESLLVAYPKAHPDSDLIPDVDKKLAVAYQKDNKPAQAAEVYARIAARPGESEQVRQESTWLVAQLYDQAGRSADAAQAYQGYLKQYPQPFDRAMQSRQKLADYAHAQDDRKQYEYWLNQIIDADASAGAARTDSSRAMSARATLGIGRLQAADADAIDLKLPIKRSLGRRKKAMEAAIDTLTRAANSGFSDVATAATYEVATLYRHFSQALMHSERPPKLSAQAQEQYGLLLEEQAEPFDEKAIKTYAVNLARIKDGTYDEWVAKSVDALGEMDPVKYGKLEREDPSDDQAQ